IDENNNLFVSHEGPHTISKITSAGAVSTLVNIPGTKFQYLAFLNDDILVTGFTNHKIYRVKLDGTWSVYSGTGSSGSTNGTIDQASYNTPTGIGVTSDNNNVIIVENKKIRKITGTNLSISDVVKPNSIKLTYDQNSKIATFSFEHVLSGKLLLYSLDGKLITSKNLKNTQKEILNFSSMQDGIYFYNWIPSNSRSSLKGKILKI
ncbi:MAG: hypothetical protein DA407_14515, partial [Bacteroidetes bacterium]